MQRWPELSAWLVIVALMAFVVYQNAHASRIKADESRFNAAVLKVRAQEAIVFKLLPMRADPTDRLIDQMARDAHSPEDELRVAIVIGDLKGKDQALSRLDRLSETPLSPELADDLPALRTIYSDGPAALDPASQARLIDRHDYFARLALAYGVPSNKEPRKSIEQSAKRATIVLVFAGLGLLLLLLVSVGLLIAAIVLMVQGKIRRLYVPEPLTSGVFLEGFAFYFVLFFAGFGLLRRAFGWTNLQWEWLAWLIIPLTMMWVLWRGATLDECRRAFGWHTGRGWFREIVSGLAGYLAGLVFVAMGLFLTFVLIRLTNVTPRQWLTSVLKGNVWHVLALYALVCVFAPVIEETMFRGALFHHLRRRWHWLISATVVASVFAIMHPQGWVAFPALGAVAMVLAALREWRGSIIAPMAAHAFNNFIVLTVALALFNS